jgi:hypothetical protein
LSAVTFLELKEGGTMKAIIGLFVATVVVVAGWPSAGFAQVPVANHYLCHKVKDLKVPSKFGQQLGVYAVDQVGNFTGDVKKPYLLCNPAFKNGSPIVDANLHYCCYKFKSKTKVKANFDVTDQFGTLRLGTKKPFLVCNPCSKAPAP